jgi:hypothetical protein
LTERICPGGLHSRFTTNGLIANNMKKDYIKISVNDPFDLRQSVRGFNVQLSLMQSDIYFFYFTFALKRELKLYKADYWELFNALVYDIKIFADTSNAFVINGLRIREEICAVNKVVSLRFGLELEDEIKNPVIVAESRRYRPYCLWHKKSKSYVRLRIYYERTLLSHLHYLYKMACVYTASKYRIPPILARQFNLPDSISFHLLDQENDTVMLIINLIEKIIVHYREVRAYNLAKPPRPRRTGIT